MNRVDKCDLQNEFAIACAECGEEMDRKTGRSGMFYGCSSFPKCKYTADHGAIMEHFLRAAFSKIEDLECAINSAKQRVGWLEDERS